MIGQGRVVKTVKRVTLIQVVSLISFMCIDFIFNKNQISSLEYYEINDTKSLLIALIIGGYIVLVYSLFLVDYYLRKQKRSESLVKKITINEKLMILVSILHFISLVLLLMFI